MTVSIVATLVWEKLCNRKLSNEKYRNFKPNFKNKSFAKISISDCPKNRLLTPQTLTIFAWQAKN